MTKKRKQSPQQIAIENLIFNVPSSTNPDAKTFWAREMKLMTWLRKKYPEDDFWINLKFPWKLKSLAYLRSKRGSVELGTKYNEYKYVPPPLEEIKPLGEEKVGEDKKVQRNKVFLDEL